MLFQAIAIYWLYVEKIGKNTNYAVLDSITLNESSHIAEGWFDMRQFSVKEEVQEYFQNIILSIQAIVIQHYFGFAPK